MPALLQSGLKTWTCHFKKPHSPNNLTKGRFLELTAVHRYPPSHLKGRNAAEWHNYMLAIFSQS